MKTHCKAGLLVLCLLPLSQLALGQSTASDTRLASAISTANQLYANSFPAPPQLYNGPEYVDYSLRYHGRIGHQFFSVPEKQPGSVYYNDHQFTNLRLAYDVVLDQVVLPHPTNPLNLRLINEWVRSFTINDHRFIRLVADSASRGVIRTGYYEVLVNSTVQVLAKRAKRPQEQIIESKVDVQFIDNDKLFIRKNGLYHAVSSKASVMRLLADRSKEMQRYVQEHKLIFNKAQREKATVALVRYYCSLPPQ